MARSSSRLTRAASIKSALLTASLSMLSFSVFSQNIYDYFYEIEQSNYKSNAQFLTEKRSNFAGANLLDRGRAAEARSIGNQAGKYWAQQEIQKALNGDFSELGGEYVDLMSKLENIYDISPYILRYKQYYVMPPVVTESDGKKSYKDSAHQTFYIADRSFHIRSEPRFVDAIPTWRTYVRFNATKPQIFSKSLLPSNDEQKKEWQENFKQGWNEGVKSAKLNLELQFARYVFDSIGIQRYHILHAAGYISAPEYKTSIHPVSGNDKMMYINNKYVSITVKPKLDHDYRNWRVIPELPVLEELIPSRYHQILQYGTGL